LRWPYSGVPLRSVGIILIFCFFSTLSFGKTYQFIGSAFPGILEKSKDGIIKGRGAEIIYKIAGQLDIEFEINFYPWKRALLMMEKGEADVLIGPYKTKERTKYLDYSNFSFYEDEILLYTLADSKINWSGEISNITDLKIGVIGGWSLGEEFELIKDKLNVLYLDNINQLFTMLKLKRIDIAISHDRASSEYLSINENKKLIKSLRPPLSISKSYFGFSKKRDLLKFKKEFEAEYRKLKQ